MPLALVRYLAFTRGAICETRTVGASLPDYLHDDRSAAGEPVHRCFSLRIADPEISAEQLATIIGADLDLVSPWEVLRWETLKGEQRRPRPGDELRLRMAGPWNGPLRIAEIEPGRVRLRTMAGNALKGELELRVRSDDGALLAEVELWERAADRPLAFLHDRLGVTARMQTHVWVEFLQRTRLVSGGSADGPVRIRTARGDRDGPPTRPAAAAPRGAGAA